MDNRLLFEIVAVLALILANGFFALSEFSIIASRKSKLREKATRGKTGAAGALKLHQDPERFLATIQVGITLVGVLLGVLSGATFVRELEALLASSSIAVIAQLSTSLSVAAVVLTITVLSVIIGELVPKYIALSFPERYARYVSGPIGLFVGLTSFFSRSLTWVARLVVKGLGVRRDGSEHVATEDEINLMLVEGLDKGVFDKTEQQFIRSVFDFSDSTVRRAMRPRADVIGFEKETPPVEIVETIIKHGYSRYPVYEGNIDKVIGVIYAKDLIGIDVTSKDFSLATMLRQPLFVPDSLPLAKLLKQFQKGKNHQAVVLDEFGGTFGIITLEDILEELVGEIQDEYDEEAAPVVKHSDILAYADGNVWPGEINELLNCNLPEETAETLAGLFMDTVGRLPEKHESVRIADARLTVLSKDENRVLRMKIEKMTDSSAE